MTLPIREYVLDSALETALQRAKALQSQVQMIKAQIDAGPNTSADILFNLMNGIKTSRDIFATVVAMQGLLAYARTEFNDPTMDIVADFNAIITACDNCLTWIDANYPKDGSGYVLNYKIVNSALSPRVFTPAALAGLSAQLTTLLAAFA